MFYTEPCFVLLHFERRYTLFWNTLLYYLFSHFMELYAAAAKVLFQLSILSGSRKLHDLGVDYNVGNFIPRWMSSPFFVLHLFIFSSEIEQTMYNIVASRLFQIRSANTLKWELLFQNNTSQKQFYYQA